MGSRSFRHAFFTIVLVAIFSVAGFADTIRLKDGSIIKGRITAFTGGRFTIVIGEGQRRRELVFAAADIESIDFDSQPSQIPIAVKQVPVNDRTSVRTPPRVILSDNTGPSEKQPDPVQTKPATTPGSWNRLPDKPVAKISDPPRTASSIPVSTNPVVATRVVTDRSTTKVQPIEVGVRVLADNTNNGWTNSGWVVKKGQKITITATGEIELGGGTRTAPDGLYDVEDASKLLKAVPTGALIAVIGDDNNDFIYIGKRREFIASRDGALFLGVNEGNLKDNKGSFEARIEIAPNSE